MGWPDATMDSQASPFENRRRSSYTISWPLAAIIDIKRRVEEWRRSGRVHRQVSRPHPSLVAGMSLGPVVAAANIGRL